MTCPDVRPLLGVYVLGKADEADRAAVQEHLLRCAECRDELAGLQTLPDLLALVRPDDLRPSSPLEHRPEPVEPSPDQLRRLLRAAAATRVRRRRLVLAAAAAVLVLLAGAVGVVVGNRPAQPPVVAATWSASEPGSPLQATVKLTARPAGTAVDLSLSGVPAGTRCSLVVTALDGTATSAASWQADYEGSAAVTGFTATQIGEISVVAIVTSTGETLARMGPGR